MQKNVEVVNKMLESLELKTAAALAERLGCGEAAVSAWKKRGVPLRVLARVSELSGRPVEWFKSEEPQKKPSLMETAKKLDLPLLDKIMLEAWCSLDEGQKNEEIKHILDLLHQSKPDVSG